VQQTETATVTPGTWKRQLWMAVALGALGVAGPAIEARTEGVAWWYWVLVLPVFAYLSWRLGRREGQTFWPAAGTLMVHWLGVLLALNIVALLVHTEELGRPAGGIVSLLLLGLGCFAAAVHVHRVFYVSTVLLWGGALAATYVREHLWLVTGLMLATGCVAYGISRLRR